MDSKSKITNVAYDEKGNILVTFQFPRFAKAEIEELKDKELTLTVKKFKPKRSKDANAYAWTLIDKLAEATRIPKVDIYRRYIKDIGGVSTIICVPSDKAEKIMNDWAKNGIGWQTDPFPSKIKGCTNIICYEGSSEFDTEQMSRLLDLIIQDCKACDIETDTPEEIARRIEDWRH